MKELRGPASNWREIAEHEAARVDLQAEVELARLVEERRLLEVRHVRVNESIDQVATPVPKLRVHETSRRWWVSLFVLAIGIAWASGWWSVGWYMTLGWEKVLVATTIVVLPLIGWIALLRSLDIPERERRRMMAGLGLAIVLASAVAGASLAIGRITGTSLTEEQQLSAGQASDDLDRPSGSVASTARADRVKRLLAITSLIAVLFLGIASEVAAGLAFDDVLRHHITIRTVGPLYAEREWLEERLVENAHLQEAVRRRGRIALLSRRLDGLRSEDAAVRHATEAARLRDEAERRGQSFGPLFWRVAIAFAIVGVAAVVLATCAMGAERELSGSTVVLVDLSASTVTDEFAKNLRAVEGVIRRIGEGGRLTVLGITDASFSSQAVLRGTAPSSKGRFGEQLDAWRDATIREWRKTASTLTPTARGTDIFGALARAAVDCEGARVSCQLIVLSDMRQVGRGINLERPGASPRQLVVDVERQGLVPPLQGARVWVLGVHTIGVDERQWQSLRAFWTEYFRLAGATLVTFTPNRRLVEGG